MKKLLAIILVVLMSVSVMLFTACNKDQGENSSSQGRQSSNEEESSTRKRGDGASSSIDVSSTSSNDGGNAQTSGNGNNGGSGGNSSNDGNINSSNYQPPTGSYVYGTYPYSYSTSIVQVTFDITKEYTFVDNYIMELPVPSLNGTFYDSLVDAEDSYNALSASDKGMVANYSRLVEARTAYDDMATQEAISLINEMSDPSLDNLAEFANQKAKIQKLLDGVSSTSGVTNLSTYNQKVSSLQSVVVNAFKDSVSQIATFENSNDYKAKLENASSIYQIVVDSGFESQVTNEKAVLDERINQWNTREIEGNVSELMASLPSPSSITLSDKAVIRALRTAYSKEKNTLSSDQVAIYNQYDQKAEELWPTHLYVIDEDNRSGNDYYTIEERSELGSDSNSENCPGMLDGVSFPRGAVVNAPITFSTNYPVYLTFVCNVSQGATGNIEIKSGSTIVQTVSITNQSPQNTAYTVYLSQAGSYSINASGQRVYIYAIRVF